LWTIGRGREGIEEERKERKEERKEGNKEERPVRKGG
jgi:hypothetical protein